MHLEIEAGEHIHEALSRAVAIASEQMEDVEFDFNGNHIAVLYGDSLETAKQRAEAVLQHPITTREEDAKRAGEKLRETSRKQADAIKAAGVQTEEEMREAEVPWPKTPEDLMAYINALVKRPHDYGTCVYAMSMAATAAYQYVAGKLGTTGFQASCADMDILARTRGCKWGRLLNYEDLLYPQHCDEEHFPSWQRILADNAERFAKLAKEKLAESNGSAHNAVVGHWKKLAEATSK